MFCPRCEQPGVSSSASASLNSAEGKWNCLKTKERGGTITGHITLLKSTGFRIRAMPREERTIKNVRAKARAPQKPLEGQDKPLSWHEQLGLSFPEQISHANEVRGVTFDSLRRAQIGSTAHVGRSRCASAASGSR